MFELETAMQKNDEAVDLMINGNLRAARQVLRDCLGQLRTLIVKQAHSHMNDEMQQSRFQRSVAFQRRTSVCQFDKTCTLQALSQHSEIFAYTRPVYFSTWFSTACFVPGLNLQELEEIGLLCSAIVMFNMALLFHLIGSSSGDLKAIPKAKQLYVSTTQMMQCLMESFPDMSSEIALAAVNNHALLCMEHGDKVQAYEAAKSIQSFVLTGQRPCGFSTREWDGLLENAFSWFCSDHGSLCASAA